MQQKHPKQDIFEKQHMDWHHLLISVVQWAALITTHDDGRCPMNLDNATRRVAPLQLGDHRPHTSN
jgi:hypothetical protein